MLKGLAELVWGEQLSPNQLQPTQPSPQWGGRERNTSVQVGGLLECTSRDKEFCMERFQRQDCLGKSNSKKEIVGLGVQEQ